MPKKDEDSIEINVKSEASFQNEISQIEQSTTNKYNSHENNTYLFQSDSHLDKYDDETVRILHSKFQKYIDAKSLPIFERINSDNVEVLIDLLLNQYDKYE
jgi:hypothetical protein